MTAGSVLPIIIGLSKSLQKKETTYCTSVRTGLSNSVKERLGRLTNESHYRIATLLDPRYKLRWTDDPAVRSDVKALATEYMDMVNVSRTASSSTSSTSDNDNGDTGAQPTSGRDDDDLLSFMFEVSTSAADNSSLTELETYLSDTAAAEPLKFWEENKLRLPRLFVLHKRHNCVPATSAAIERCFSAAGYIVSARRSRLEDCMLEDMLVARCNKDLL